MKNKIKLLLKASVIGLLLTKSAIGQSRFSLGATVTPQIHHRDFAIKGYGSGQGTASYQGLAAGLTANYAISSKWSTSVGLLYSRTSGDYTYGPGVNNTNSETYKNTQLPILLNYASSSHRLSPYFSTGLLLNYINHVKRVNPNFIFEETQNIDGPNATTVYAMIGLGAQYRLTQKVGLIVQPTAAYQLGRPSNNFTRFNDYLLGVQTQIRVSL